MRNLILQGVRQNNLKGIDLEIPLGTSVVITGPSGSGKSSLAFETIYAEGQRRYMQSLSTYARQFLQQFKAPIVDGVFNVPPTIAIEQINPVRNSRATVATSTELYDYLRLLFEKIGIEYCPNCSIPMERRTLQDAGELLAKDYKGKTIVLGFLMKVPKPAAAAEQMLADRLSGGFTRLIVKGKLLSMEDALKDKSVRGEECVVALDRIAIPKAADESLFTRLSEALSSAWEMGDGAAQVLVEKDSKYAVGDQLYHGVRCHKCGHTSQPKSAAAFSFNSPLGACSNCNGFGNTLEVDEELVVANPRLSLAQGAIVPFTKPSLAKWQKRLLEYCKKARIDVDLPYQDLSAKDRAAVFYGNQDFKGAKGVFKILEKKKYKMRVRVFISRYVSPSLCTECKGDRLNPDALRVKVGDTNIAEICKLTIEDCLDFFKALSLKPVEKKISEDILDQLNRRLTYLNTVGLGYVALSRLTKSLSGGEYQRILLGTQLSQGLTDTLYVLDEPSIGLHPRDTQKLVLVLERLLALGNSLIVVEHDPELIGWGQYVIDMGPGAGSRGGEVVFSGTQKTFLEGTSRTSESVRNWKQECLTQMAAPKRKPQPGIEIVGASGNNLRNISVELPLGCLVVVTGVSGSGKSTLIVDTYYQALSKIFNGKSGKIEKFASIRGFENIGAVELIDQSSIGRSSRSNPITFMKGYDEIRSLYAKTREAVARGLGPGHFSFNIKGGRCDKCEGEGRVKIDMVFMEDVYVPCEVCEEKRFKPQVLAVKYKEKNIHEVLQMTVDEAQTFFKEIPSLKMRLAVLQEVGLGYLQLGQPSFSLSGGEAQRLKIARELVASGGSYRRLKTLFFLDEPTTGLHFEEVGKLIAVFKRLLDVGHSVVVIEHNLQVISCADHVIDLGPDGGDEGGKVVAVGTPQEIAKKKAPQTGRYLADILHS